MTRKSKPQTKPALPTEQRIQNLRSTMNRFRNRLAENRRQPIVCQFNLLDDVRIYEGESFEAFVQLVETTANIRKMNVNR